MYSRIGRRTRRISDGKLYSQIRNRRRVVDEDDDVEEEADIELGDVKLTQEEIQGLLELLPYKEALIKIAKGEFEIERVEEAEDDEAETSEEAPAEEASEENFEEDEDFSEEDVEDFDEDEYEDEEETETVEDSKVIDAWSKRLKGNSK